jgi:sortase (surface protein transpeptidase)
MSKNAKYNHKNRLVAAQALLKRNRGILLIMIGVFVLIFYGVSILKKHTATSGTAPLPSASITITASNSTPSERKIPTDTSAYVVPATQPRKILVPEIGVEGLIQKVGRTNKNAIAVPSSIYIAGWYVDSVLPGQKGLSIIDGHINGTYNPGIFYNLQNLTIGDKFMIEFGDYSKKTFEVVDKK